MSGNLTVLGFQRRLQRLGFAETNIDRLIGSDASLLAYADVTVDALPEMRPGGDQEALFWLFSHRSLRTRAIPLLLDALENGDYSADVRWTIADALERHAAGVPAETLIRLSKMRELGQARRLVVLALSKKDGPAVVQALSDALGDAEVAWDAMKAISRAPRKFVELQDQVRPYEASGIREMRKIATAVVAKLEAIAQVPSI